MTSSPQAERLHRLLQRYRSEIDGFEGDSVDYRCPTGDTPLFLALYRDAIEEVGTFLSSGADVNAVGDRGYTPLHVAVMQPSGTCIAALLSAGANVNARDDRGRSAIDLAKALGDQSRLDKLLGHTSG